jgi:asparagine synthase (glutamine-hydrolysing)
MCGIAGVIGPKSQEPGLLIRMSERMVHRGPDSNGTWADDVAGLAIRRLAIIDLDERSNQPLHLGPLHLVFNGEIYNYRELRAELRGIGHEFVTEGDGEVILHAWAEWGELALNRLDGMFAIALWDGARRELTCARDPFGEKPLFWAVGRNGLAFASEIRALLAARPDLDTPCDDAMAMYLGSGVLPPVDKSFFAAIHQLPGAHLLRFRAGRADVQRYWQPQAVEVPSDFRAAAAELRGLLERSVRLRLRSDVAVGSSLSGGVDSSAIVCLAGQMAGEHRRHAFTARFPGFERDEWPYAELVARAAGVIEHHAVEPRADAFLTELETVVRFQEEPFVSASIYAQWRVMEAARQAGITVLLDGQGADELFGGYAGSNGWALRSQGLRGVVGGLASQADRRDVLRALVADRLPSAYAKWAWRRVTTPYALATVRAAAARLAAPTIAIAGLERPLARELLRQSFHTSMPGLLRYADRNSMAHSREVRLPFLDRRVAEFALSLPAGFLYRNGFTKAVLREAVRDLVPNEVLMRRDKVGYEPPQERWLADPVFVERIRDVLLDPGARARGVYEIPTIEKDARRGSWRDPYGIWRALNLELWLNAFCRPQAVA